MTDPAWRPATVLLLALALMAATFAGLGASASAGEGDVAVHARAESSERTAANRDRVCALVKRKAKKAKKVRVQSKRKLRKLPKAQRTTKKAKQLRKKLRKATRRVKVAKKARKRLCRTGTHLVSVSSKGVPGNGETLAVAISATGRHVVFSSDATNLVAGDTNGATDVFVHDLVSQRTKRVSVSSNGRQGNEDSGSESLAISANGRYVAFSSGASNLVPGDTNGAVDVFVRDLRRKKTTRVSVTSKGAQAAHGNSGEPQISANGRYVAFASEASNLTSRETRGFFQIYLHDRVSGLTSLVSHVPNGAPANGRSAEPSISADGRYIAYSTEATNFGATGDTWEPDVYVWDRKAGRSYVASVDDAGRLMPGWSIEPSVSNDGQIVAYSRLDEVLNDIGTAVTNRALKPGSAQRSVSYGSRSASGATVSGNGRYVALVDGGLVTLHDRVSGAATRVDEGWAPSLTTNASGVAFLSGASELVSGDTNRQVDAFVRRR